MNYFMLKNICFGHTILSRNFTSLGIIFLGPKMHFTQINSAKFTQPPETFYLTTEPYFCLVFPFRREAGRSEKNRLQ